MAVTTKRAALSAPARGAPVKRARAAQAAAPPASASEFDLESTDDDDEEEEEEEGGEGGEGEEGGEAEEGDEDDSDGDTVADDDDDDFAPQAKSKGMPSSPSAFTAPLTLSPRSYQKEEGCRCLQPSPHHRRRCRRRFRYSSESIRKSRRSSGSSYTGQDDSSWSGGASQEGRVGGDAEEQLEEVGSRWARQ